MSCPKVTASISLLHPSYHVYWFAGPLAPFGVPIWKPFRNFRLTVESDRIRPVPFHDVSPVLESTATVSSPVVFLLFAFSDQLYFLTLAAG